MIIDIQGSTALIRDKDIEQGREWVEKALLIMQEEIQTLGGEIIQTAGDGVTACFYGKEQGIVAGIAALTVQKKLQQSKLPLKARAGIHASILRYGGKEDLFSEHDMFITQYIESLAPATEVYISHRVSSAYEDTFIMDDFIDTKLPDKPLFIKVSRLIDVKTNIDLVALKKQYQERVSAATTTTHELSGEKKNITSMFIKVVSKNVDIHSNLNKKFLSIAEKAIRQYSGTLIREMGNSLFAIFGAPVAFEDHSLRACLAAYSIKESLGIENNVTVYMGLHSGEAVVDQIGTDESRQYDALGIAVNLAARMMQTASENSIQLTRSMANRISQYIVIDNIMPKTLKGFDHPIATCQLVSILSEKIRKNINRQLYKGTHFVGRDYEKRLFMDLWQSAIRQYKTQCLAIRADPGMGKTRLSYEYAQKILNEGGKIYAISSSAYEQMEGFSTVVQLLKDIFNLGFGVLTLEQIRTLTEEVEKKSFHDPLGNKAILSLLGVKISDTHWVKLDATLQKKIIFDSVVDLLNEESKTNPLLLFFEDLHWCDEDSLNFITFLVTQNRLGSCMIVLDYRPEFTMPDEMKTGLTEIVLEPLSDEYSRELLEYLLPGEDDLSQLKNAISTLSQGNPFFIEEYINTILTQGGIIKEKNKYRLNPNYNLSELPPTIQGVISSRVDQLPKESKYFLQQASVLGRVFQSSLLRYLCGLNEADFKRQLTLLEEKGFLVETALFPQPEYTFKHAHICDAVYKGMLIKQKKEEHARIVEQIEVHEADRLPLFYSILAEHAYQAALWLKALHYYNEMVPVGESLDFPNPRYLDVEKKVSYCFQELTDVEKKANFDAYGRVMMRYLHACLALTRFDLFEMGIKKMLAESIHYENKLYEMLVSVYKMAALFASVHASSGLAMCKEILNFIKQDKGISLGDKKEEVYLALYTGLQHIFWATGNYALFDECVTKGFELLKDKPFYYYSELIGLAPAAILYFHLFVCHSLRARFDMIEEKLPYLQAELSKVPPSEFAVAIAISFGIYEYSIGKLEEAEMKMTTSLALSERMHLNFLSVIPRAYLACIKYYKGNKSQAILYAKNSIEMYKKMHYGFSSYVAILLSEILARCGCYEEALEVISDIMTLAVADNHQLLLARCYSFKALTYSLMTKSNDKEDEILELLAKAQAITRELGCNSLHPNIELIYVEFYKHLNQPEKAKEHYQKALNYFEEYHMMGWYEYYKNKNIDVL